MYWPKKLEADVATIYNYINTLGSKIVTPMFIYPIDLKTILTNTEAVIPPCLSLPNEPNINIWSFYKFLEIHPLIYNETLTISLIVLLVDSIFHIQLYCIHTMLLVNRAPCKTFKIEIKTTSLAIIDDEKYFTHSMDMDITKWHVSKGHYCSLSGGLYPIYNDSHCTLALYFKNNIQIKSFCPISVNNIASNFIVQLNKISTSWL